MNEKRNISGVRCAVALLNGWASLTPNIDRKAREEPRSEEFMQELRDKAAERELLKQAKERYGV